jgi:mycothiol synthase
MTTTDTDSTHVMGVTFRPFDPAADYGPAAELIREANAHDGTEWLPSAESLEHDMGHDGSFRPAVDARVAAAGDGRPVGLAVTGWRRRGDKIVHRIELLVRPSERRRGIGTALLGWAEAHVTERSRRGEAGPRQLPVEIGGWGEMAVPGHAQLAAGHGYRVVRYGMDMLRRVADPIPEAPLPDGIDNRPVRPDQHQRIWEADVEAFRDHWESPVRTEADFDWWFRRPDLDTSLWQVAWDGDEVVGSILTTINREENARLGIERAWLDHISVRRPWRRRGVAAALIASTLRLLAARGVEQAALGVDTENLSGAVRLYERMGFVPNRTGAHYRKPISP